MPRAVSSHDSAPPAWRDREFIRGRLAAPQQRAVAGLASSWTTHVSTRVVTGRPMLTQLGAIGVCGGRCTGCQAQIEPPSPLPPPTTHRRRGRAQAPSRRRQEPPTAGDVAPVWQWALVDLLVRRQGRGRQAVEAGQTGARHEYATYGAGGGGLTLNCRGRPSGAAPTRRHGDIPAVPPPGSSQAFIASRASLLLNPSQAA